MDLQQIRKKHLNPLQIWIEDICIYLIQLLVSPSFIPRHIAFIMDGNRRFAKMLGEKAIYGHSVGFESMMRVLDWCLKLGVKEVSVYAFSLDNFQRSQEEVEGLMNLALARFEDFTKNEGLIMKEGIRVRILGKKEVLSDRVREAAIKAENATKDNKRAILNICFAYSSNEEIYQAALQAASKQDDNDTNKNSNNNCSSTITADVLSEYMYAPESESSKLDLVVRTSGETRLSDFLLWQIARSQSYVQFIPTLWPELKIYDMAWIIFRYRWSVLLYPQQ